MATNKSKNNTALLAHTEIYSGIFFLPMLYLLGSPYLALFYISITFVCHTIQDWLTSRLNTYLWNKKEVHWFFVSIGFDQLLHFTQLLLTYQLLTN